MDRVPILKFLKRALRQTNPDEPCRFVKMIHAFDEKSLVRVWEAHEFEDRSDVGIDLLCSAIMQHAEQDAHGLGGTQRYQLQYYVGSNQTHQERISFHVHGPSLEESEEGGGMSEGPTKQGQISQQMRHNEGIMKISIGATTSMLQMMQRENQELRSYVRQLEEQRLKNAEVYEELLSKKHERDLETRKQEASERRKEAILARVIPVIPLLINKVTGKNLLPEGSMSGTPSSGANTPEAQSLVGKIKKIFEGLTYEQFEKFKESLGDEAVNELIAIYQQFQAEEAASQSNGVAGLATALVPTTSQS